MYTLKKIIALNIKKTLALCVALMLVVGLLPTALFADNTIKENNSFRIQMTVGSSITFSEWAVERGLTSDEISDIISGLSFTAYQLSNDENGTHTGTEYDGVLDANGYINFSKNMEAGRYEVVEIISGTAVRYFGDDTVSCVYYVGANGFQSATDNFVSGQGGVGTIVSHDGIGVNWELPKVWDDFFTTGTADATSKTNYAALKNMGA